MVEEINNFIINYNVSSTKSNTSNDSIAELISEPHSGARITPFKISVVILIQEYLKLKIVTLDDAGGDSVPAKPEISPDYKRKFCMLLLKLIQHPDMSYKDLFQMVSSDEYNLQDQHLEGFKKVMNNLDKLGFEILYKLQSVIEKLMDSSSNSSTIISQSSVVGLYFRRIALALDKMPFQDLMKLYKNLLIYYEKGIRTMTLSFIAGGPSKPQSNYYDEVGMNSQSKWSLKQAELFVARQSALLENDETNAISPKEINKRLCEIIQDNPLYSQAYFLSYMNNMRVRDLPNSIEALHRAFDRSTLKPTSSSSDVCAAAKGNFQFSILNLAILHTLYGHQAEALRCLKECIMTAQENGDKVCLQLAQLWLCLLDKSNFQLSEKNIANKTELSLVHSVSLNIQSLVKVAAVSGYLPAKLFDVLLKSDLLNCQHSMMDLLSNCIAERAGMWTLYGKNEIASLCSQLLLNSSLRSLDRQHNEEGLCQSFCSLALWLSLQGEYTASSLILQHAKERFPRYPSSNNVLLCEYYIVSQQSLFRENWNDANAACCNMYILDSNLSLLQRANLNLHRGNRKLAQIYLSVLLDEKTEDSDLKYLTKVRGMVMMAHTLIQDNFINPEAIIILNKASILAKEKYLEYEHAMVEINLAYMLLKIGMPQQALKIVKANLENILSSGGIYDKAKTIFLFVQTLIASSETKDMKLERLNQMSGMLTTAVEYFTKMECYNKVKSVYYYLAKLYNDLSMIEERNKYALKFRLISEQYTNNCNHNFNIFH